MNRISKACKPNRKRGYSQNGLASILPPETLFYSFSSARKCWKCSSIGIIFVIRCRSPFQEPLCAERIHSAKLSQEVSYVTTAASAIKDEVWELIDAQIKTFGQPSPLTPSELSEFSYRAERIRQLGQELDRIGRTAIRRLERTA